MIWFFFPVSLALHSMVYLDGLEFLFIILSHNYDFVECGVERIPIYIIWAKRSSSQLHISYWDYTMRLDSLDAESRGTCAPCCLNKQSNHGNYIITAIIIYALYMRFDVDAIWSPVFNLFAPLESQIVAIAIWRCRLGVIVLWLIVVMCFHSSVKTQ